MPTYRGEHDNILTPFTQFMAHKLASSKHRGTTKYLEETYQVLLKRLRDELEELEEAIASGNNVHIIMESADVANFVMFIGHRAMIDMASPPTTEQPDESLYINFIKTDIWIHNGITYHKDGAHAIGGIKVIRWRYLVDGRTAIHSYVFEGSRTAILTAGLIPAPWMESK